MSFNEVVTATKEKKITITATQMSMQMAAHMHRACGMPLMRENVALGDN